MQKLDSNPSVKIIHTKTTIKEHKLSFGTQRILKLQGKTNQKDRPKLKRPQQFHKDGPTLYDDRLFDSVGNLKSDGPPETSRKTPFFIPPHPLIFTASNSSPLAPHSPFVLFPAIMSLRLFVNLSNSLSSVHNPRDLGKLVGTISGCLESVMQQSIRVYRGLPDKSSQQLFLQSFRSGLLDSNVSKSYVNNIMTTLNQCCLEGMIFYHLDPSLNKDAQKQKANEKRASDSVDGTADDEGHEI
jgi:hypothetical protein